MADVALDASVIVAILDDGDVHHARATALVDRLERDGHALVLLDLCVTEAVSVLCRRAAERKTRPPVLAQFLATVRTWHADGEITWVDGVEGLFDEALRVVESSAGALNFNDALLVRLHAGGVFDDLASFDADFDQVAGFTRVS